MRWSFTVLHIHRAIKLQDLLKMAVTCMQAESWAFAVDADALQLLAKAGVFGIRTCKLCEDGVVVMGEYGLSTVLLKAGHGIATLMSM